MVRFWMREFGLRWQRALECVGCSMDFQSALVNPPSFRWCVV
jgi:hypothetical protein